MKHADLSLNEEDCERQCDAGYPMPKDATGSWWHDGARMIKGVWSCPNCGLRWNPSLRALQEEQK